MASAIVKPSPTSRAIDLTDVFKDGFFSDLNKKSDLSFADPDKDDKDDLNAKVEEKKEEAKAEEPAEAEVKEEEPKKEEKVDIDEVINSIDEVSEEDEKKETRGRKKK